MYAKSKSNAIAKLDGTFKIPTSAAQVEVTDLQQSIFNAPPVPGASTAGTNAAPSAPHGLPSRPPGVDHAMADAGTPDSRGMKRPRDEKEEEEEEKEESDSDVAMEEDSDDE